MDKLKAALIFFTRIPFWRVWTPDSSAYSRVVDLWPLAGWITGCVTATVWLVLSAYLPPMIAAAIAIAVRLMVTGALHEDGLADFFDGFGGGTDRERILSIMKDSHIGSYGVIALVLYLFLTVACISSLPPLAGAAAILAADTWGKTCASQIINFLPYARKSTEAKNLTVYKPMSAGATIINILSGVIPCATFAFMAPQMLWSMLPPIAVIAVLISYFRHKIGGYTGDCCGAAALLCELSFMVTATALI